MKVNGIKMEVFDVNSYRVRKAIEVANDYNASIEEIEKQMRKLFFHDFVTPEIVETYNKLEKKWKILTNYKENTRTPVLWEEK